MLQGVRARFIRLYSNGNSDSRLNEYTEVEIYARPSKISSFKLVLLSGRHDLIDAVQLVIRSILPGGLFPYDNAVRQAAVSLQVGSVLLFLTLVPETEAQISWTNLAGGNWNSADNWSPNGLPTASDSVSINLDGNYTVTLNVAARVESLTSAAG